MLDHFQGQGETWWGIKKKKKMKKMIFLDMLITAPTEEEVHLAVVSRSSR